MATAYTEMGADTDLKATVPRAPEHLNSTGLRIGYSLEKGRGVYADRPLAARTVIEISPVLLFTSAAYEEHGRHTIIDHYTFKWKNGCMALALGLGSLFNHSQHPNVSYTIDTESDSIRYSTTRPIEEGEELCIFYGNKLWFDTADAAPSDPIQEEPDDVVWGGLANLEGPSTALSALKSQIIQYADSDPQDLIAEDALPFSRIKLVRDDDEDELSAVRTQPAWVADVPDARYTATILQWLKQSGLDTPTMSHLKRIRKQHSKLTVVLALASEHPHAPRLPDIPGLSDPYEVEVPSTVALTQVSLKHKNTFWPTVYAPRRKGEAEQWTGGRVLWACKAMRRVVRQAQEAGLRGELPIAAYVPLPYEKEDQDAAQLPVPFLEHDTRTSANHPLRHAVLNTIRAIADHRASSPGPLTPTPSPPPTDTPALRNGAHYLLTSLALFTTHEPCIMCSMALLHSRVKEVFYLIPMPATGGCGSVACVPALKGVNHRYSVSRWKDCEAERGWAEEEGMMIGMDTDA